MSIEYALLLRAVGVQYLEKRTNYQSFREENNIIKIKIRSNSNIKWSPSQVLMDILNTSPTSV